MKAEHIEGNERDLGDERGDQREHDDPVCQRLSFLDRRLETLLEQRWAGEANTHGAHCRTDENHPKEHPGTPPAQISCWQEQQGTEDGHVAKDADDQLEDVVASVPVRRRTSSTAKTSCSAPDASSRAHIAQTEAPPRSGAWNADGVERGPPPLWPQRLPQSGAACD